MSEQRDYDAIEAERDGLKRTLEAIVRRQPESGTAAADWADYALACKERDAALARVRRYEAALRDAHRTIVEANAAESWSDVLDLITAALADDAQPPAGVDWLGPTA